jgi:hypothetical protein
MKMNENDNEKKCGVVYLFAYSLGYAERLAVSLFTLRRHWHGPITIMVDDVCLGMAGRIAADPRITADTQRIEAVSGPRHSCYITKSMIPSWTPYDYTLLIDGDTTIHGPLDELFEGDFPLTITQFSNWQSQGGRVSQRINWWRGRSPAIDALVAAQLARPWPAINTGVISFRRGYPQMATWHAITKAGAGLHMTDELAMQLLQGDLPADECRVVDDRWNWSPQYGVAQRENVRIIHFHGGKHVRKAEGRRLWEPEFRAAFDADVGGMKGWAGKHDPGAKLILGSAA